MANIELIENQLIYLRECLKPFQIFTDAEWTIFSSGLQHQVLKKKELLCNIGDVYQSMAFVTKGAFRHFFEKEGEIITKYFNFKGEMAISYTSFITGKSSYVGVEAIDNTEILVLSKNELETLSKHPILSFKMEQMRRKFAEYSVLCYDEQVESFLLKSPEERYFALLKSRGDIFQKVPQHYIANYLGITAESLSRIRN